MRQVGGAHAWTPSLGVLRRDVRASVQAAHDVFFGCAVVLASPLDFSLDDCVEYIQEDELVEITPKSVRMLKNPKVQKRKK